MGEWCPAVDERSQPAPPTLLPYTDPVTRCRGWVAFDGWHNRLAAGGFRVDPRLTGDTVAQLAQAMSRKQAFLGLGVDGAKCGLAYRPDARDVDQVASRFLGFVRPQLLDRFSMGPDMGTSWGWVERLARRQGLPSVKIAVAKAQGISEAEFLRRHRLLDEPVGESTLGAQRAGHALAHACLATLAWLARPAAKARVAVQGVGTLGRAALRALADEGCRVVAVADEQACVTADDGLDVDALLHAPHGRCADQAAAAGGRLADGDEVVRTPADALVLAACEDAVSTDDVADLAASTSAVVVGANLGLTAAVETALNERGVVVVPDFVGGCGGPASMNALFGPGSTPTAAGVLAGVERLVRARVREVLEQADRAGVPPRAAAQEIAERNRAVPRARPYGDPVPEPVGGGAR